MTLPRHRNLIGFLLTALAGSAACGGSEQAPLPPPPPPPPAMTETPPPPPAPPAAAPAPEKAMPDIAFGPTTPSDAPKKMPKVTIKSPGAEQIIAADKAKDFDVKIDVKDWETQTGGPHVHLILDNKPYKPVYDPKAAVKLGELMPAGDSVAEGEHLIVAFPSRMNHESVKGPGALAMVHFWVGKKGKSDFKAKDPMLVYSRPKGTYNASKADHVLVDWYLANVELGESKASIKANVSGPGLEGDGRTLKITEWRPYALDNLRNGDYKISLELDDKDGKAIPGGWNATNRTITINRDAPEDPAPMPPATATDKKKDEKPGKDKPKDGAADKKPAEEKKPEKK